MRGAVPLLLLAACGARTELGGERDGGASACAPAAPATASCSRWVGGAPHILVPAPAAGGFSQDVGAAVTLGCGVLVAWYQADSAQTKLQWMTRLVGFDGAPLADPVAVPALTDPVQASTTELSVAVAGGRVGVLQVDAAGCRFTTLDGGGHALGDSAPVGAGYCVGLAGRAGGWSFVRASGSGAQPPFALVTLDGAGGMTDTPLEADPQQLLWDRLAFDDGSFLLDTFWEDTATAQYSDWLTPYDPTGAALGPRVQVYGFDSAPVWLAPTATGALAAWTWGALFAQPVDRHGTAAGLQVNVTGAANIYATDLVPDPNGDVLLAWKGLEGSQFSTYAAALGPDATPRGPITQLALDQGNSRIFGAIDATGTRAVLVSEERGGVQVLPLTCE